MKVPAYTHTSHQNGKDQEDEARRHPSKKWHSWEKTETTTNMVEVDVKFSISDQKRYWGVTS